MNFEEAKKVFLNRGYVEVEGGTLFYGDKWREAVVVISRWLEEGKAESELVTKALQELRQDIEASVLEKLSDGGDDWFAAEKVNDCLEIIDRHIAKFEERVK